MARVKHGAEVNPNRLFAAADVLLEAIGSPLGYDAQVPMYDGPDRAGGMRSSSVFTSEEFIEAMAMLMRMGLLPSRPGENGGGSTSQGRLPGGTFG